MPVSSRQGRLIFPVSRISSKSKNSVRSSLVTFSLQPAFRRQNVRQSVWRIHYSLFFTFSLQPFQYSLITIHYSLFIRYSMYDVRSTIYDLRPYPLNPEKTLCSVKFSLSPELTIGKREKRIISWASPWPTPMAYP